ncbi:hypothetical protein CEUSTIGMA_g10294.t1 [Chlamydomonas eustigma]|uniref:Peptidase S54 rhomboid domain-containing protein n=1 Tax=Chlamydomonas eustigma TaxID=1157962 RepID=A0A250XIG1_9CHLO|nr:hypothetical protein CEUSTIGMA_g10294.t1 [Chlamydomonas eustigma]|eukprot:GAX82868.1 hypothetical protein CEUSTIGMA_g10294.t1 [Chlamydomonas eustigma]
MKSSLFRSSSSSSCSHKEQHPLLLSHRSCKLRGSLSKGPQSRFLHVNASKGSGDGGLVPDLQKYNMGSTPSRNPAPLAASTAGDSQGFDIPAGVAALVLLNCALFVAAIAFKSSAVTALAINPSAVSWWSFISSAFVHHNFEQLGRNMFILFFFSKLVYRDLGAVGVWFTYILGAVGANVSSWVFLAGAAKVKAVSMLGVASSGGAMAVFLASMVLSFTPSLAWVMGVILSGNVILGMMLQAPVSAAAAAAAKSASSSSQGMISPLSSLVTMDPVAVAKAVFRSMEQTAVSPGNSWVLGAAVAAAVVVVMARLPDPDNAH